MMKNIVVGPALVLLVAASVLLWNSGEPSTEPVPGSDGVAWEGEVGAVGSETGAVGSAQSRLAEGAGHASEVEDERRSASATNRVHGLVESVDQQPIASALVTWTPRALTSAGNPTTLVGPLAILEASESVETDAQGRFEFSARASQEPGVVWAAARGFEAGWIMSPGDQREALVLSLEQAKDQLVRVSRSSGESAEGAVAMLVYARSALVGENGTVRLPAWNGRRLYTARLDDLRSVVEISDGSGEPVELVLEESILLAGSVSAEGGESSVEGALLYCFLYDVQTWRQRYVLAEPLTDGGRVEGVRLPWTAEEGYRLVVEGEGLARTEEWFEPVPAGGTLAFNHLCQAGGGGSTCTSSRSWSRPMVRGAGPT